MVFEPLVTSSLLRPYNRNDEIDEMGHVNLYSQNWKQTVSSKSYSLLFGSFTKNKFTFTSLKVGKKLDKILKIQKNYKNIMLKKLLEFMPSVNFLNVDVNANSHSEMKK